MTSVGTYEARTQLPKLLAQVAKGKKILITKRGRPVAMLVPPPPEGGRDVRQAIQAMKALRQGSRLGEGLSIRGLIEEGRR